MMCIELHWEIKRAAMWKVIRGLRGEGRLWMGLLGISLSKPNHMLDASQWFLMHQCQVLLCESTI